MEEKKTTTDDSIISYDELQILVANAILLAQKELTEQCGDDEIFGFALGVDDGVSSMCHIACTRKWVRENEGADADSGYIFVEWDLCANDTIFDEVSSHLSKMYEASSSDDEDDWEDDDDEDEDDDDDWQYPWEVDRDARFGAIVAGVLDIRNRGIFNSNTLLIVGSPDPSPDLEALGMKAVDTLNNKSNADNFARALGYEEYR